jgi:hypothetical protein
VAGEPEWEIATGYGAAFYRGGSDTESPPENSAFDKLLPVGWFASFAARTWNWLSVVAEVSGEYATLQRDGRPVDRQAFSFLDGLRADRRLHPRAIVFGEILLGVVHDSSFQGEGASANRFAWQPAGGLDVALTDRVSVRFQGGARFVQDEPPGLNAYQFLTGVVVSSEPR